MVIVLTGPDSYRSLQRLEQLREAFRAKFDQSALNISVIDTDTATVAEVRDAIVSGGLFARRRMVILDRYDQKRSSLKPAVLRPVLADHLTGQDVIIIVREISPVPSSDRRKKTAAGTSLSMPGATTEEFPLLSLAEATRWVADQSRRRQIAIDPAAVRRLVEVVGVDTWRLHQELEKLGAYAVGRAVTVIDIEMLTVDRVESDIFGLLDSIGNRQTERALRLVRSELQSGTHPLVLVAALTRHVENLLGAKSLAPASAGTVATTLGIHPYVATKAVAQAQRFEQADLVRWHTVLFDIDRELKSTGLDAETLLMSLIGRT